MSDRSFHSELHPRSWIAQTDRSGPVRDILAYVTGRLIDDPHLSARTLCDEIEDLARESHTRRQEGLRDDLAPDLSGILDCDRVGERTEQ